MKLPALMVIKILYSSQIQK